LATKDCLLKTDMLKTINKNSQSSQKTSAVSRQKKVRLLRGRVISDKMDKTIVVLVSRLKKHPRYQKRYKIDKKYKVDDEKNEYKTGDQVVIKEGRPMSKDKRWKVDKKI